MSAAANETPKDAEPAPVLSSKAMAVKRLIAKSKSQSLKNALIVMLATLSEEALQVKMTSDVALGAHDGEINFALLSMMTDTSAIDVEKLLEGRTVYDADRVLESSKKLLDTFLRIVVAVQRQNDLDDDEAMTLQMLVLRVQIIRMKDDADVYASFWQDDSTYTKTFCAFMSRSMTQRTLLWSISDIVLLHPTLYRTVVGLKSTTAHIDKMCDMAEKYLQIPKLHLWDAYDRVINDSALSEEEIIDVCKTEICDVLGINRVLIEKDMEAGNVSAAAKWIQHVYKEISSDKGRSVLHKLTEAVSNDATQLSSMWKEAKGIVGIYQHLHKDTLKELFETKGREMLPQVINHFMNTAGCDEKMREFVQSKISDFTSMTPDKFFNKQNDEITEAAKKLMQS